jgi:hypothetical protein
MTVKQDQIFYLSYLGEFKVFILFRRHYDYIHLYLPFESDNLSNRDPLICIIHGLRYIMIHWVRLMDPEFFRSMGDSLKPLSNHRNSADRQISRRDSLPTSKAFSL